MKIMTLTRQSRAMAVISLVAMAIVATSAGTAQAGVVVVTDGFEGGPASRWNVERYGNSNGGFDINAGLARSGSNNAWLTAQTSFSAVGRVVTFGTTVGTTCGATIHVRNLGGVSQINMEVIDHQSGNYIGLSQVTLSGSGNYLAVNFPGWQWSLRPVALRVALIGNNRSQGILLDDLNAQCGTRYP